MMRKAPAKIVLPATLLLLYSGYAVSPAYTQEPGEKPLHDELPQSDNCSIITMHIRDLAFTLKKVIKEISALEAPVQAEAEDNEEYQIQKSEFEANVKSLYEKESSLRKEIDLKEQQLEDCTQRSIAASEQKE